MFFHLSPSPKFPQHANTLINSQQGADYHYDGCVLIPVEISFTAVGLQAELIELVVVFIELERN